MESADLAFVSECGQREGEDRNGGGMETAAEGRVVELEDASVPEQPGEKGDGAGEKLELRLDLLPEEVIIHICSFLDAKTILHTLSKVCTFFQDLLTADAIWKTQFSKRWHKNYPPVPVWEDFDWKTVSLAREESEQLWQLGTKDTPLEQIHYTQDLYAAVDVVHLMQEGKLLAAGSRDRQLTLLDISKYESNDPSSLQNMKVYSNLSQHNGWIWSMASSDRCLATGSWDCHVRLWDVEAGMQCYGDYRCSTAILDLYWERELVAAACYDKNIYFIDPRAPGHTERCFHRQAVLCLAGDDRYIISGSEDKTIVLFDRRRDGVLKRIQMEGTYPLDMTWGNNQLWVADKHGRLHLYDTSEAGRALIKHVQAVQVSDPQHKLTGVASSLGAIFTTSTDGYLRVFHPTLDPEPIGTLHAHIHEIAGLSYQNSVLATAGCNESIGIWCPRQTPVMA